MHVRTGIQQPLKKPADHGRVRNHVLEKQDSALVEEHCLLEEHGTPVIKLKCELGTGMHL